MGEAQLISLSILVLLIFSISVGDSGASSSPLAQFLHIPKAHLHTFIVQTVAFSETSDHKMCLPLDTLYAKIKPSRYTVAVGLFLQRYLICISGS